MDSTSHTYDAAKDLRANSFTRTGYIFNGWNTQANGSGDSYTDEQSVSNLTASQGATVTLYAQWLSTDAGLVAVHHVTDSDPGGGNGTEPAEAITWVMDVGHGAASVGRAHIVPAAEATFNLYSDSGFETEVSGEDTISLPVGTGVTVYIKVTAQDTTTERYYAVAITRVEGVVLAQYVFDADRFGEATFVPYGEHAGVTVSDVASWGHVQNFDLNNSEGYGSDPVLTIARLSSESGYVGGFYLDVTVSAEKTVSFAALAYNAAMGGSGPRNFKVGYVIDPAGDPSELDNIRGETSADTQRPTWTAYNEDLSGEEDLQGVTDSVVRFVWAYDSSNQTDFDDITITVDGTPDDAAALLSVLGRSDSSPAGGNGQAAGGAITWSLDLGYSATEIAVTDIDVPPGATFNQYSNADFTDDEDDPIALTVGVPATAYIKVTSESTASVRYYAVTATRGEEPTMLAQYNFGQVGPTTEPSLHFAAVTAGDVASWGDPETFNVDEDLGYASAPVLQIMRKDGTGGFMQGFYFDITIPDSVTVNFESIAYSVARGGTTGTRQFRLGYEIAPSGPVNSLNNLQIANQPTAVRANWSAYEHELWREDTLCGVSDVTVRFVFSVGMDADNRALEFDSITINVAPSDEELLSVNFDPNGGATPEPASKQVVQGQPYGPLATVVRPGYHFNGWFTAAEGGEEVTAETEVTESGAHTLYAQWRKLPTGLVLQFNYGGSYDGFNSPAHAAGTLPDSLTDWVTVTGHNIETEIDDHTVTARTRRGNGDGTDEEVTLNQTSNLNYERSTTDGSGVFGTDLTQKWAAYVRSNYRGRSVGSFFTGLPAGHYEVYAVVLNPVLIDDEKTSNVGIGVGSAESGGLAWTDASLAGTSFAASPQTATWELGVNYAMQRVQTTAGNPNIYVIQGGPQAEVGEFDYHTLTAVQIVRYYPINDDASLISVLGESDADPGSQAGTVGDPITWSLNVANEVEAVGRAHIEAASGSDFFNLYSDDGFSTEITGENTIALIAGDAVTVYIKVQSTDETTTLHYAVTINRAPPVTVTFNANGGTDPVPDSKVVSVGLPYGDLPATTRTGYTFEGWFTAAEGGDLVTAETEVTNSDAHTLYAQWTIIEYTVTYNANGGENAPVDGNSPYNYDDPVTVLAQGDMIREGFTFVGWNTAANGSGTAYQPSATFSMPADDVTLFAQWAYIVTLDPQGGEADPVTINILAGTTTYPNTLPMPTRADHAFNGWNTAPDGSGVYVTKGSAVAESADHTLYAQWRNLAGASSYLQTFDNTVNRTPLSEKDGWGWATADGGVADTGSRQVGRLSDETGVGGVQGYSYNYTGTTAVRGNVAWYEGGEFASGVAQAEMLRFDLHIGHGRTGIHTRFLIRVDDDGTDRWFVSREKRQMVADGVTGDAFTTDNIPVYGDFGALTWRPLKNGEDEFDGLTGSASAGFDIIDDSAEPEATPLPAGNITAVGGYHWHDANGSSRFDDFKVTWGQLMQRGTLFLFR